MIENPIPFSLNIATLVIIFFSFQMLVHRALERPTYAPLAVCLLATGVVICQPTLAVIAPDWQPVFLVLSLPAMLILAPAFWFYVKGITSETPWTIDRTIIPHMLLFAVGAIVAILTLLMPDDVRTTLLVEGRDSFLSELPPLLRNTVIVLLILTFVLVLGWIAQTACYLYAVVKRLNTYRAHLKDLFATTDTKELGWISWLLIAVGTIWLTSASSLVLDNLFYDTPFHGLFTNTLLLITVWTVALWGLRQKPGFEELYDSSEELQQVLNPPPNIATETEEKYQRSGLSEEQAMENEQLYLDASLSLQKLAKQTSTSPNYISQTLSQIVGSNFFDYVNQYRIKAAQVKLKDTSASVLDVAMDVGFNAKSSFYTAFKKETGMTPSQYRKSSE